MTDHLLTDLAVHAVHRELRPLYRVTDRRAAGPNGRSVIWDFTARAGQENLAQAVILRILTPRGELAALGHPEYGSRVHELVGRPNNATQRNVMKLFILEALKLDPRVEAIKTLEVRPSPGTRSTVDVLLEVKPAAATNTVKIGPFTIDLGE